MAEQTHGKAVQTTGHAWDGDLQEFNNPLPSWWLWSFYATVVFALVYWIFYPAWPVGRDFTKGVNTVTFESKGEQVTTHWNTRAALIAELQTGELSQLQQQYLQKVSEASFEQIMDDADMMAFTRSTAKVLFADNCAACHGSGGVPAKFGLYPNLADDAWLWGGSVEQIAETLRGGRFGYMPAFGETLNDQQLEQVAAHVLSLSGHQVDAAQAAAGKAIFEGQTGGCHYCHTAAGTGLVSQGAANLTDAVWTVADVPGAATPEAQLQAVKAVIRNGIHREMPAWKERLTPAQVKLLAVYVHSLGGGQ
jgi:cytochrome c oxidase cbb3-type subunit 3